MYFDQNILNKTFLSKQFYQNISIETFFFISKYFFQNTFINVSCVACGGAPYPSSEAREQALVVERAERVQLLERRDERGHRRRVHEVEREQVVDAHRLQREHRARQVRPLDLGHVRRQHLVAVRPLRVQAVRLARPRAPGPARALLRLRLKRARARKLIRFDKICKIGQIIIFFFFPFFLFFFLYFLIFLFFFFFIYCLFLFLFFYFIFIYFVSEACARSEMD